MELYKIQDELREENWNFLHKEELKMLYFIAWILINIYSKISKK